jgi:hypothetical protein
MVRTGFNGADLTLNDRMFDPANDLGEEFSVFRISLAKLDLPPNKWSELRLDWNLSEKRCQLTIDGRRVSQMAWQHPTLNGLSYVRFRSTAEDPDSVGLLVEKVTVSVLDPFAPLVTADAQRTHEKRYVERIIPRWDP